MVRLRILFYVQAHQDVINAFRNFGRPSLIALLSICTLSCSGGICDCHPTASTSRDFRHDEKHVPLPSNAPIETSVTQILTWPAGPNPTNTTPRSGRELTLYHIATAFLQNARIVSFDCDVHAELSEVASKSAPRVIVETPIDREYCANREGLDDALERHHFRLRAEAASEAELPQPMPVSVVGLAFRDFEHDRGTKEVGTPWELHPAEVTVLH